VAVVGKGVVMGNLAAIVCCVVPWWVLGGGDGV
jgi:hypothetical protein